jgi:hypothetical protein
MSLPMPWWPEEERKMRRAPRPVLHGEDLGRHIHLLAVLFGGLEEICNMWKRQNRKGKSWTGLETGIQHLLEKMKSID